MSAKSALSALTSAKFVSLSPYTDENGKKDLTMVVIKHPSMKVLAYLIASCGLTEAVTFAQGPQMARCSLPWATLASATIQTVEVKAESTEEGGAIKALLAN